MDELEAFFKVTEAIKEIRHKHNHRSNFFLCHFFSRPGYIGFVPQVNSLVIIIIVNHVGLHELMQRRGIKV